ncbi:hypothetical protein [Paracraurococcus lichenis]|uniref:Uncharacterized protein n=1 Tax=Paracraurococcus lichenis TaxID=3064888 RepID=A0ABT9E8S6_9PROT|nr:hypothetical protein [Paracraurococcus sp. LOR1-02]MDO9712475.1 hypothetical protein [Paracraurococcus sp. LOR1-02]
MPAITINGTAHTISDNLKCSLSDALLAEVKRCAQMVAEHPDADALFGITKDRSTLRETANRDGLEAQRMHGSLWSYDATEAQARWNDALYLVA